MARGLDECDKIQSVKIRLNITLLAAWFCFIFFAGASAFAMFSRQYVLMPGLLAISGFGFFILFYLGNFEMDEHSLQQLTLSGKYEILWDDVKQVEIRKSNSTVVFRGDNKVLTILGHSCWPSKDAEQIIMFILAQMEARNISLVDGGRSFRFPRNTKIGK